MAVTHISETEAARDLPQLLARVRSGERVQIDFGPDSFAIVHSGGRPSGQPRLLSDILADLRKAGSTASLDGEFGKDVEDGIRSREQERLTFA